MAVISTTGEPSRSRYLYLPFMQIDQTLHSLHVINSAIKQNGTSFEEDQAIHSVFASQFDQLIVINHKRIAPLNGR